VLATVISADPYWKENKLYSKIDFVIDWRELPKLIEQRITYRGRVPISAPQVDDTVPITDPFDQQGYRRNNYDTPNTWWTTNRSILLRGVELTSEGEFMKVGISTNKIRSIPECREQIGQYIKGMWDKYGPKLGTPEGIESQPTIVKGFVEQKWRDMKSGREKTEFTAEDMQKANEDAETLAKLDGILIKMDMDSEGVPELPKVVDEFNSAEDMDASEVPGASPEAPGTSQKETPLIILGDNLTVRHQPIDIPNPDDWKMTLEGTDTNGVALGVTASDDMELAREQAMVIDDDSALNEADLTRVQQLRREYQQGRKAKWTATTVTATNELDRRALPSGSPQPNTNEWIPIELNEKLNIKMPRSQIRQRNDLDQNETWRNYPAVRVQFARPSITNERTFLNLRPNGKAAGSARLTGSANKLAGVVEILGLYAASNETRYSDALHAEGKEMAQLEALTEMIITKLGTMDPDYAKLMRLGNAKLIMKRILDKVARNVNILAVPSAIRDTLARLMLWTGHLGDYEQRQFPKRATLAVTSTMDRSILLARQLSNDDRKNLDKITNRIMLVLPSYYRLAARECSTPEDCEDFLRELFEGNIPDRLEVAGFDPTDLWLREATRFRELTGVTRDEFEVERQDLIELIREKAEVMASIRDQTQKMQIMAKNDFEEAKRNYYKTMTRLEYLEGQMVQLQWTITQPTIVITCKECLIEDTIYGIAINRVHIMDGEVFTIKDTLDAFALMDPNYYTQLVTFTNHHFPSITNWGVEEGKEFTGNSYAYWLLRRWWPKQAVPLMLLNLDGNRNPSLAQFIQLAGPNRGMLLQQVGRPERTVERITSRVPFPAKEPAVVWIATAGERLYNSENQSLGNQEVANEVFRVLSTMVKTRAVEPEDIQVVGNSLEMILQKKKKKRHRK